MVDNKLAHRCFKCGGFWADSDVINSLTSAELVTWRRISVDPRWFTGGTGACPLDGMKLEKYVGESIPQTMLVKRCIRCGKWWFAGDTLHLFKPAQEAKLSYYRQWRLSSNVSEVFLPLLVLAVLGTGLVTGITLLRNRQQLAVPAAETVTVADFAAVYIGNGEATISFTASGPVYQIEYRQAGETSWLVEPAKPVGMRYVVGVTSLMEGVNYEVKAGDQLFEFVAR